jgi:hypothetical protein
MAVTCVALPEKERRDHGKTPSYKSSNEGIVPGFRWRELAAGWRDTTGYTLRSKANAFTKSVTFVLAAIS